MMFDELSTNGRLQDSTKTALRDFLSAKMPSSPELKSQLYWH